MKKQALEVTDLEDMLLSEANPDQLENMLIKQFGTDSSIKLEIDHLQYSYVMEVKGDN